MHPSFVRHIHATRIFHVIRSRPGISQAEIVTASGTDKSTVSAIVKRFEEAGLVKHVGKPVSGRPGRPGAGLALSEDGGLLVGVHPKRQELRFVVSGLDGHSLTSLSMPMPSLDEFPGLVANGIRGLAFAIGRKPSDVRAVGISVPGMVSHDGGVAYSPNLDWRDIPLRELLAPAVEAPLFVDNDANGATLAEAFFARPLDAGDFFYIETGSGTGSGIFADGELSRGPNGFAGEIGHFKVAMTGGRLCPCGRRGCLAAYISDWAIAERAREVGLDVGGQVQVAELASNGSAPAQELLAETGRLLGFSLSNVVNLMNVREIVLGGGLARISDHILGATRSALQDYALPTLLADCEITVSSIASVEAPLGGIAIALDGCTNAAEGSVAPWQISAMAAGSAA